MTPHIRMRMQNKGKGEFRAEGNTIWLYDAIATDEEEAMWFGGIAPASFIAALKACSGPVTLRINSPGGSVFGAQAVVVAMREYPDAITAQVDSIAASAASVIAAECARCIMVPGSMLMIHKAWGMVVGNEDDLRGTADLLAKIDGLIAGSYARRSDGASDHFLELMRAETWFSPEEAIAEGLADEIKGENSQRPAAKWNLSAFANAPAEVLKEAEAEADGEAMEEALQEAVDPDLEIAARQRNLAARLAANPI